MFLRIVRLQVRPAEEARFTRFYAERVIPALDAIAGCLYAGLLAPWRGDAHQSLTIWDSEESARRYEESGLYGRLLAEAAPFLAESTAWHVRLATDPLETSDPARREIPATGYNVEAQESRGAMDGGDKSTFVRIVSLRVDPDHLDEFAAIYRDKVIPALREVAGCRGVFLAEGAHDPNGVLSITFWNREEDAVRYEMSGVSDQLTAQLRGTISPVYDWRLTLGAAGDSGSGASGLAVTSYQLVRGRRLDPPPAGSKSD